MENLILVIQIYLAIYFIFWGLNGFFNWVIPPKGNNELVSFLSALESARFIMPMVKCLEILGGLCLLSPMTLRLAVLLLAPIIVVITTTQIFLNSKKAWIVILQSTLPFLLFAFYHSGPWFKFLFQN